MWEFSIYLQLSESVLVDKICSHILETCKEYNIILSTSNKLNGICISIACEKIEKPKVLFYIADCLTEIICIDYKEQFLTKFLNIKKTNDLNFIALKKALINFDKETDMYIVNKNLVLESKINLSAFFDFKLGYLKDKWLELTRIANENTILLSSNENIIELLKFLIDNLEINYDVINLVKTNNNYYLYDNNFNKIEIINNQSINEKENIIENLINLCPRKLILYIDNKKDEALDLIKQLFYRRITVLPNKFINNKINSLNS